MEENDKVDILYDIINDSYEFALIKKIIKREYPWVKDIVIRKDDLESYSTIFLNPVFDIYELAKSENLELTNYWTKKAGRGTEELWGTYLSTFYNGDNDLDKYEKIFLKIIKSIKESSALPEDLKTGKSYGIGRWIVSNDSKPDNSFKK